VTGRAPASCIDRTCGERRRRTAGAADAAVGGAGRPVVAGGRDHERIESGRTGRRGVPEAELVEVGAGQSLIVVDASVFRSLPGVHIVPFSTNQAFLALQSGRGMADLELAVQDRLSQLKPGTRTSAPLVRLLAQLQAWRRSRGLGFETRSIILVSRQRRVHR